MPAAQYQFAPSPVSPSPLSLQPSPPHSPHPKVQQKMPFDTPGRPFAQVWPSVVPSGVSSGVGATVGSGWSATSPGLGVGHGGREADLNQIRASLSPRAATLGNSGGCFSARTRSLPCRHCNNMTIQESHASMRHRRSASEGAMSSRPFSPTLPQTNEHQKSIATTPIRHDDESDIAHRCRERRWSRRT